MRAALRHSTNRRQHSEGGLTWRDSENITVTIDENGDAEIDLQGFHGRGCDAVMKGFNKALGGEITSNATKAEYNKPLTKNVCVKGGR